MSVQTAPHLSPKQKYLLQSAAFTLTSQIARTLPVDLWRLCCSQIQNDISQQQQQNPQSSPTDKSLPANQTTSSTTTFTVQEAAQIIALCQAEGAGIRASLSLQTKENPNQVPSNEESDNACPTPLCTPLQSETGPNTSMSTYHHMKSSFFTVKSMAQLLAEEQQPQGDDHSAGNDAHHSSQDVKHIVTFSEAIDELCGGKGIECGCVTELVGAPGMGKTQLCMQLSVAVQLPNSFGGVEGDCLYIDTEGSFVPSRFKEIAAGAAAQVQKIVQLQLKAQSAGNAAMSSSSATSNSSHHLQTNNSALSSVSSSFTADSMMKKVHYIRVTRLVDLLALIESLPQVVAHTEEKARENHQKQQAPTSTSISHQQSSANSRESHRSTSTHKSNIRLIVIDSIAFHFRYALGGDAQLRSRTLFHVGQTLQKHAASLGAAVVVTNQLTSGGPTNPNVAGGSGGVSGANVAPTESDFANSESSPQTAQKLRHSSGSAVQAVPALGDSWAHTLTYRLWIRQPAPQMLQHLVAAHLRDNKQANNINNPTPSLPMEQKLVAALMSDQSIRSVNLMKAPNAGRSGNIFRITTRGVRNVNLSQYATAVSTGNSTAILQ